MKKNEDHRVYLKRKTRVQCNTQQQHQQYEYIHVIIIIIIQAYMFRSSGCSGVFVLVAWIIFTLISCHSIEPPTGKHANITNNNIFFYITFTVVYG